LDPNNKISFSITKIELRQHFKVDENGRFMIISNSIRSIGNTIIEVPILLADLQGLNQQVTVYVQPSACLRSFKCPRIADSAQCDFVINKNDFDSGKHVVV